MIIINPIGVLSLSKREILRFVSVASQTVFPPLVTSMLFMYIFGVAMGNRMDFSMGNLSYLGIPRPRADDHAPYLRVLRKHQLIAFIARWHNHIQEVLLSPLSYFEMSWDSWPAGRAGSSSRQGFSWHPVFSRPCPCTTRLSFYISC